jgi:hypothetical protein
MSDKIVEIVGLLGEAENLPLQCPVHGCIPGGPTHFERETASIKTSWNSVCEDAGIEGATPKTLRHTMLTWLAERGVPAEQRQKLAGHSPKEPRRATTSTSRRTIYGRQSRRLMLFSTNCRSTRKPICDTLAIRKTTSRWPRDLVSH